MVEACGGDVESAEVQQTRFHLPPDRVSSLVGRHPGATKGDAAAHQLVVGNRECLTDSTEQHHGAVEAQHVEARHGEIGCRCGPECVDRHVGVPAERVADRRCVGCPIPHRRDCAYARVEGAQPLQLDWGWSPAHAAIGLLPQVVVLVDAGPFVGPFVGKVGLDRAGWLSAAAVVAGLGVYALASSVGYVAASVALVLVAAGIRVNGVVAGTNVLRGLPADRTSIGAALVDTASEVATGAGIGVTGTILAALFTGTVATSRWNAQQTAEFHQAVTAAGLTLTVLAAALVGWGIRRARRAPTGQAAPTTSEVLPQSA